MTRLTITLALLLWGLAVGRDQFDHWIDATVLPPLEVEAGVEVFDRNGALLRPYTVADGRWRLPVERDGVDPTYVEMLIRYEDKRFHGHAGVDFLALLRGVGQALRHGEVISGGSTLTMQVARLIEDGPTGEWGGKLRQMRVALALERRLEKDEILALYFNRAPFGGNLEGVRAASFAWFGKPPRRLTPAQSALLVALPQSPEMRRPDRHPDVATSARNRVLERLHGAGILADETVIAATARPVTNQRYDFPARAPHLSDRVLTDDPLAMRHDLTIDRRLQTALEDLAEAAISGRSDRLQVAMVVADHGSGEVLAHIGSGAYQQDRRAGFVDLTQAKRSPGSTLKPLVYGLGFDRGMIHPETLIADRPTDFDGYRPQNFDGFFRGELRVRDALQQSLNIPVVSITQDMGPWHLMTGMRRAGMAPEVPGNIPGLAVALGGVGVSLHELVQLYAGIARGGEAVNLHWVDTEQPQAGQRIMGPVAAWQIADILLQAPRPIGVRGVGIAYKTGTSYGHRDAWAIGFDGRHVIGVWMGRADGTAVPGAFGGDLAAPIMFQAFARLKSKIDPIAAPPPETLLLPTSQLPLPLQRFRPADALIAQDGPVIAFPPDGAELEGISVTAKVTEGRGPFTWLANGRPVLTTHAREVDLGHLGAGFSSLTVIDANGLSDRAQVALR